MNEDSTVVRLRQPEVVAESLTEVLRAGARRLLAQAIEAEAEAFLAGMVDRRLADGRARFVRHGHGPERTIQTGIGSVAVQRVKVRDRAPAEGERRLRFTSRILPRWARRTRSLDALLPVLYLRGVSTGDFPAEHWDHLRSSNPIESVFATVRHRTVRTKGALSQESARLMVFKLVMAAARTWRRLKGENQLPKVIDGVTFSDGIECGIAKAKNAA